MINETESKVDQLGTSSNIIGRQLEDELIIVFYFQFFFIGQ